LTSTRPLNNVCAVLTTPPHRRDTLPNPHKTTIDRFKETGLRVVSALVELIAHLAILSALLLGIKLLEMLVHRLWGNQDYLFFNTLKLRYIFDGADLAILIGFLVWGVYSVVTAYIRNPE